MTRAEERREGGGDRGTHAGCTGEERVQFLFSHDVKGDIKVSSYFGKGNWRHAYEARTGSESSPILLLFYYSRESVMVER